MTNHIHALAMRTKAAERAHDQMWALDGGQLKRAILALPLEAEHAALLAEAVKLEPIKTLIASLFVKLDEGHYEDCDCEDCKKVETIVDQLRALGPPPE